MRNMFDRALQVVLEHEGGYVDHPADPGGATNLGITHRTLAAWRGQSVTKDDVKRLTVEEAAEIYHQNYWNAVRANELPPGVDLCVFDMAVNAGPNRAIILLQRTLGVADDGIFGPVTMSALQQRSPENLINSYTQTRLAWYQRLSTWATFGRGWTNRVNKTRDEALKMLSEFTQDMDVADKINAAEAEDKTTPEKRCIDAIRAALVKYLSETNGHD